MEDEEFAALVESIRTKGLLNPIWLHPDGSILDGRNRYRACLKAGVLYPKFAAAHDRIMDGPESEDAILEQWQMALEAELSRDDEAGVSK